MPSLVGSKTHFSVEPVPPIVEALPQDDSEATAGAHATVTAPLALPEEADSLEETLQHVQRSENKVEVKNFSKESGRDSKEIPAEEAPAVTAAAALKGTVLSATSNLVTGFRSLVPTKTIVQPAAKKRPPEVRSSMIALTQISLVVWNHIAATMSKRGSVLQVDSLKAAEAARKRDALREAERQRQKEVLRKQKLERMRHAQQAKVASLASADRCKGMQLCTP